MATLFRGPWTAALVSLLETAILLALGTFLVDLGLACSSAAHGAAFVLHWAVEGYTIAGLALGCIGKGILAYVATLLKR